MKKAEEIRSITNASKANFEREIERIEKRILDAAHDGRSLINETVPVEIAVKIRNEFTLHGYTASNHPGSSQIEIKW